MKRLVVFLISTSWMFLACSSSESSQGAGGSGGAGGAGGSGGTSSTAICEAVRSNYQKQCATYADGAYKTCQKGFEQFVPVGCGQEFAAYETCQSTAALGDCSGGTDPCQSQHDGYFACQSQFTQSTGCSILGAQSYCVEPTPYAFGCVGTAPTQCKPAPIDASTAYIYCCPSFAK